MRQPIKWGKTNDGTPLFEIKVDTFKDRLQLKLLMDVVDFSDAKPTRGGWYVYHNIEGEYCSQLTAEVPIVEPSKNGRKHKVWKKVRQDNHLFDCEVYSLAVAAELGMQFRPEAKAKPVTQKKTKTQPRNQSIVRADGRDYWDIGIGNYAGV